MKTLNEILQESIDRVLNERSSGMITEMAIPRRNYKERVDAELPQVFENWCLIHYRTITDTEQNKKHWQGEFRGHMYSTARLAIKSNDSEKTRRKVLNELLEENEYDNPHTMNLTVCNKFIDENIDINSKEYKTVIMDCIGEIDTIFDLIISRNNNKINDYANQI